MQSSSPGKPREEHVGRGRTSLGKPTVNQEMLWFIETSLPPFHSVLPGVISTIPLAQLSRSDIRLTHVSAAPHLCPAPAAIQILGCSSAFFEEGALQQLCKGLPRTWQQHISIGFPHTLRHLSADCAADHVHPNTLLAELSVGFIAQQCVQCYCAKKKTKPNPF